MRPGPHRSGPQAQKTVLPNGLRVLTERLDHVDSASLGLWVASGSRHEPPRMEGITHFLEHMLFKGTNTRTNLQIAEAIDDIGGHVNGFTDREAVYLYARTIGEHAGAALELLFDLFLHSVCADEEVEREREVVLQEIGHVEDVPEGWVHELLPQTVWADHALGRPLMGVREGVKNITREALLAHIARLRAADNVIVSAAGQVHHEHVLELAASLSAELKPGPPAGRSPSAGEGPPKEKATAPKFRPQRRLVSREGAQVHFCLAAPGCGRTDDLRHPFTLLDAILGGGNSSRLFQEIREKRGLAYDVGSSLQSYRETGLFVIDGSCAPENFGLVLDLIGRELERMREEGPSDGELERARAQLRVALALAAESTSFRMQHLAVSELYWGRVLSFDEIIAGVEQVTAEEVRELAKVALRPDSQALVAIGPFDSAQGRPFQE